MMYRCDPELQQLQAKAKSEDMSKGLGNPWSADLAKAIAAREKLLLPLYKQVAVQYCDLHDRSGRMKGLGAIHEELTWAESRSYLHWRIRRRAQATNIIRRLREAIPALSHD